MDSLAEAFDSPLDSPDHRMLAEDAWLGGPLVSVRYYLGRLIGRNLFRESDDEVLSEVRNYFAREFSKDGAAILQDARGWKIAEFVMRSRFEATTLGKPRRNRQEVQAVSAFLANPKLSTIELATSAETTIKQLARMSTLQYARTIHRLLDSNRGTT